MELTLEITHNTHTTIITNTSTTAAHCLLLQEIQIDFGFTFLVLAHPCSPGQIQDSHKMVVVVVAVAAVVVIVILYHRHHMAILQPSALPSAIPR